MTEVNGPFLTVATLKKWRTFHKFQDISPEEFVAIGVAPHDESATFPLLGRQTLSSNFKTAGVVNFISHRWASSTHPDPDGRQLLQIAAEFPDDALIWYDYSCVPQEPRTPSEDEAFRAAIDGIPALISRSWFTVVGPIESYSARAWCQFEVVCALHYGNYLRGKTNEQTNWCLKESSLYKEFKECLRKLPRDTEPVENSDDLYLRGYFVDVPDLDDRAFAPFKSNFFQLQASELADPPVLWEILRKLFPARREDMTYRSS